MLKSNKDIKWLLFTMFLLPNKKTKESQINWRTLVKIYYSKCSKIKRKIMKHKQVLNIIDCLQLANKVLKCLGKGCMGIPYIDDYFKAT